MSEIIETMKILITISSLPGRAVTFHWRRSLHPVSLSAQVDTSRLRNVETRKRHLLKVLLKGSTFFKQLKCRPHGIQTHSQRSVMKLLERQLWFDPHLVSAINFACLAFQVWHITFITRGVVKKSLGLRGHEKCIFSYVIFFANFGWLLPPSTLILGKMSLWFHFFLFFPSHHHHHHLQHIWCLGPCLRTWKINCSFFRACCTGQQMVSK